MKTKDVLLEEIKDKLVEIRELPYSIRIAKEKETEAVLSG